MKPYLVGIAGPSCSGKSLLAERLAEVYAHLKPLVLSLDSYYHDLSGIDPEKREKTNFDIPEAIDVELLQEHLRALLAGKPIEKPIYDFVTHTRLQSAEKVVPGNLIFLEGLFALYWESIRNLMDSKIFVAIPEEAILARRLERDVKARGRSRESVIKQYDTMVKPMNQKYVLSTNSFADIVVDGSDPIEKSVAFVKTVLDRSFG